MSNRIDEENNQKNSSTERQVNISFRLIFSRNENLKLSLSEWLNCSPTRWIRNWHEFLPSFLLWHYLTFISSQTGWESVYSEQHPLQFSINKQMLLFFSIRKSFHWMNSHITVRYTTTLTLFKQFYNGISLLADVYIHELIRSIYLAKEKMFLILIWLRN